VSDFGFSKFMDPKARIAHSGSPGTLIYRAPEMFEGDDIYTMKVDVYSYGILIYTTISAREPYEGWKLGDFALTAAILNGKRPDVPEGFDAKWKALMKECWHGTSPCRPSFDRICERLVKDFARGLSDDGDPSPRRRFEDYRRRIDPARQRARSATTVGGK